ncbi:hypothetical protein F0562_017694 [Nyssa sinensis]|uniref:Uncharacterized protein n=1 Tax=Nyssa sinensis TaxID=561372 RepID=A0A5J4ZJK9_9ASTE|nr:hypothetical protein F0562_017694 [Nyssa sinensis]
MSRGTDKFRFRLSSLEELGILGTRIEIEGDGSLGLYGLGKSAEINARIGPGVIGIEEVATHEAEHISKLDNVYASSGADNEVEVEETNGLPILPESNGSFAVAPEVRDQYREHVVAAALDEEKSDMPKLIVMLLILRCRSSARKMTIAGIGGRNCVSNSFHDSQLCRW